MKQVIWVNPKRRRNLRAVYTDNDYVWYYDIDLHDFTYLVMKIKRHIKLDYNEDIRYGKYIQTMCEIVLEHAKFKRKPETEKEDIRDKMAYDLCIALPKFDETRGSSIYSFSYRLAYLAGIHYYTERQTAAKKEISINAHLQDVYSEYRSDIWSHKINNVEIDR